MAGFIISTDVTLSQMITFGDMGFVTGNGSVVVASGSAVLVDGGGRLSVAGMLGGVSYGAYFYGAGQATLTLAGSGFVTGLRGVLMINATSDYIINNAGMIQGALSGASLIGLSARVYNSGQIIGNSDAGLVIDATDSYLLSNSGTIEGSGHGAIFSSAAGGTISNSGRIAGGLNALNLSYGADKVINTGVLSGDVLLGAGADSLYGGLGQQDRVFGGDGADLIVGGANAETLDGGNDNDVLRGNWGDDALFGAAGADTLVGGGDDDSLDGGAGLDVLYGGGGNDTLMGGIDRDVLYGGGGSDIMNGGAGADVFVFGLGNGSDRIFGFTDNLDRLDLREFHFGSVAVVAAVASDTALGLRIDLRALEGGMVFLQGMTLAQLSAADLLL